jgi:ABC-type lipoprotein export system ATPase subunit
LAVLELHDVSKQYKTQQASVRALDGVSLQVAAGEFVSIVGRSGCGKTTLLNLAGAMDSPTSGKVILDGADTSRLDDAQLTGIRRSKVGFVFQFFQLLPTLTAVENVELPLLLAGNTACRTPALERLRWVEMEDLAARLPHQLSGGQMQRVAIARALVHSPRILLADEPIGNLDGASAEIVMRLLRRVADEFQAAVVMATHSLEAAEITDTIVQLRDGRVEDIRRTRVEQPQQSQSAPS